MTCEEILQLSETSLRIEIAKRLGWTNVGMELIRGVGCESQEFLTGFPPDGPGRRLTELVPFWESSADLMFEVCYVYGLSGTVKFGPNATGAILWRHDPDSTTDPVINYAAYGKDAAEALARAFLLATEGTCLTTPNA